MARKILLADDSVTAQNMGRKILADAGYEVITVNNGSAALKKISEQKPDLIVLDVYMPGYSGLEVCQRLKEVPETSRIPVLLTVGKLEPFKPEEAKRVRAEGFIVKPFEASELLSALSKLEDKVVPRSESSKPGRFARAIAAVEQSSRDKSEAAEEDLGWKNRISFPKKKKNKEAEVAEDGDDPAIYNAVNKDLRTVVPHEEPHKEHAAPVQEDAAKTVDVAAVVPADLPKDVLPKDVTPEEIAAIAAAAAQVQAAAAGSRETSETPVEAKIVATEPPSTVTPAEPRAETKSEERVEARSESKAEEVPPATFAEHKGEEKTEPAESRPRKRKNRKTFPWRRARLRWWRRSPRWRPLAGSHGRRAVPGTERGIRLRRRRICRSRWRLRRQGVRPDLAGPRLRLRSMRQKPRFRLNKKCRRPRRWPWLPKHPVWNLWPLQKQRRYQPKALRLRPRGLNRWSARQLTKSRNWRTH